MRKTYYHTITCKKMKNVYLLSELDKLHNEGEVYERKIKKVLLSIF